MAIDQDSSSLPAAPMTPSEPILEAGGSTPADKPDFITHNSLRLAGVLNAIGDVAMLVTGVKRKDKNLIATGSLYTAGALTIARYGKADSKRQLDEVSIGLAELLEQQTGGLPDGSELAAFMQQKRSEGLLGKTDKFLYRHSADVMLGTYTAGAATALASGIKNKSEMIGYGAWSLAVKAVSFLTPEKYKSKTAAPENAGRAANPMVGSVGWFTAQPLRIFGVGSMISEVLLSRTFLKDLKSADAKAKNSAVFGLTAAGAYMASDVLMTISNKQQANASDRFTAADQQHLRTLAAETIAKQPKARQAILVHHVAQYLAARPEITGNEEDLIKTLTAQVAHMENKPWAARVAADTPSPSQLSR